MATNSTKADLLESARVSLLSARLALKLAGERSLMASVDELLYDVNEQIATDARHEKRPV